MKAVSRINILICFSLMITFVAGCDKQRLEPNSYGEPVVYFKADFNGKPFDLTIENGVNYAKQSIIDDSVMRYFIMHLNNPADMELVKLVFNNHNAPFGDVLTDLDLTISTGSKGYTQIFPPPFNPMQTNSVAIEYQDKTGKYYSSVPVMMQNGAFSIDSVYQIKWVDGKNYKLFISSFECMLYNVFTPDSILITNGSALLAFEIP
jgi:hypothetical protein